MVDNCFGYPAALAGLSIQEENALLDSVNYDKNNLNNIQYILIDCATISNIKKFVDMGLIFNTKWDGHPPFFLGSPLEYLLLQKRFDIIDAFPDSINWNNDSIPPVPPTFFTNGKLNLTSTELIELYKKLPTDFKQKFMIQFRREQESDTSPETRLMDFVAHVSTQ